MKTQAQLEASRRYKARRRGDPTAEPLRRIGWSEAENEQLRIAYATAGNVRGVLTGLTNLINRTNISRQARRLGLAVSKTRKGGGRPNPLLWAGRQHPRGMLGKKHRAESRAAMSLHSAHRIPVWTQKQRDHMSRVAVGRLRAGGKFPSRVPTVGKRADLGGQYFRSRWEANYARFLNWSGVKWEYEARTFWFDGIKRGTRSYTPDFWLPEKGVFHEVKGWMDPKSITRHKRMKKYHPGVEVVIIDGAWFKAAGRQGLPSLIPGWETDKYVPKKTNAPSGAQWHEETKAPGTVVTPIAANDNAEAQPASVSTDSSNEWRKCYTSAQRPSLGSSLPLTRKRNAR